MEHINTHQKHIETLNFNQKMLLKFCDVLGYPWTVYLFCLIAFIGLTQIKTLLEFITWFSQTLIQFVALAVIQGGSNLQSRHAQIKADEEYKMVSHQDKEMDYIISTLKQIKKKVDNKKR